MRDVVTGKQIPFEKFIDMYVVKVHPTRAILEMDYFIKMIEEAELRRDEEILRIESALEDENGLIKAVASDTSMREETEWEKIQKLPDADYLMRTVMPVLYQGIRVINNERPAEPLQYLSLYLLKHQD